MAKFLFPTRADLTNPVFWDFTTNMWYISLLKKTRPELKVSKYLLVFPSCFLRDVRSHVPKMFVPCYSLFFGARWHCHPSTRSSAFWVEFALFFPAIAFTPTVKEMHISITGHWLLHLWVHGVCTLWWSGDMYKVYSCNSPDNPEQD